jgi:DNA-binding PadR family transcriptional regulator
MPFPPRVTKAFLDVLEVLVQAAEEKNEIHGWAIKKSTGLSGATTYKMFDRLEDAGWITGRWEPSSDSSHPPRRYYQLTPTGEARARALLAERRPAARRRTSHPHALPERGPISGFMTVAISLGRRMAGGAR